MQGSLAGKIAQTFGAVLLLASPTVQAEGVSVLEGSPLLTTLDVDGSGAQLVTVLDIGNGVAVFEGDVLVPVTPGISNRSTSVQAQSFSVALGGSLWPDGIMPYVFDSGLSSSARAKIEQAIEHWNNRTPIRLVERSNQTDYVNFIDAGGCASYIGRIGGKQDIYASSNCSTGNFIHEIGHALGLYHEHTRPDRDDYVTVNWSNISSTKSHNFDVVTSNIQVNSPYDYGSIMHYGSRFFSINGEETITVKRSGTQIGQRLALSDDDLNGIKTLYKLGFNASVDIPARKPMPNTVISVDITLVNNTGSELSSTSANITLPAGVVFQQATGSSWSCSSYNPGLSCSGPSMKNGSDSKISLRLQTPSTVRSLDFDFNVSAINSFGVTLDSNSSDTLAMTATNDPPQIVDEQTLIATAANSNLSSPIGQVQAKDLNGHALSGFTIQSESHSGLFRIEEGTGEIFATSATSIDTLGDQTASVGVTVFDGFEYSDVTSVTVSQKPKTSALSKGGSDSGGGAFTALWLLALLPLRQRRKKRLKITAST